MSEHPATHRVAFHVDGRLVADVPLTHGQAYIWDIMEGLGRNNGHTNFGMRIEIGADLGLDAVAARLREIFTRHESLRTLLHRDEQGELRQTVLADVAFDIELRPGPPDEAVLETLRKQVFDRLAFPARIYLFGTGPARLLLVVFSHMVTDGWGWGLLRRELDGLFRGELRANTDAPPPWHPFDQWSWESSPEGRAAERQGHDYWRATLAKFPPSLAAASTVASDERGWWQAQVRSAAMGRAVGRLAREFRVSETVVISSLAAVIADRWFGLGAFHVLALSANRLVRRTMFSIAPYSQGAPLILESGGAPFGELLRRNYAAVLRASQHSSISPRSMQELKVAAGEAGGPVELDCWLNVHIPRSEQDAAGELPPREVDDGAFRWNAFRDSEITTLYFEAQHADVAVLQADSRYIPKSQFEPLLRLYRQLALHLAHDPTQDPGLLARTLFAGTLPAGAAAAAR